VQFERWKNTTAIAYPVFSITNATSRKISVRGAIAQGVELAVTKDGNGHYPDTFAISPNEKQELTLCPTQEALLKRIWPPQGQFDVVVVPWTDTQKNTASNRYARWPKPLKAWLMRKYAVRPEHRYTVTIPHTP
jgi:hypothetical protein